MKSGLSPKVIQDYLRSLVQAGVETVPAARGEFQLELEPDVPPPELSTTPSEKIPSTPVGSVCESVGTYVAEPGTHSAVSASDTGTLAQVPQAHLPTTGDYGPSMNLADRKSALDVLNNEVAACTRCTELVANRTQTVFGVGNISPRLVFLGEGPGADEDRQGEPFVGAAGKLLDKIIAACQLNRGEVYILNTVKCRPPANRNPSQVELDHCWSFAQRQLEILQPEFICCLGSVAAKRLLNTTQSLGRLRRRFHAYRASRVLVTYHPAYLLRTESAKRHVWEDMKMLMKEMGVDLTK